MITIKNTEQIKNMKEAGHIAYNLLNLLEGYVKEGITTKRLDEVAYKFITKNEATPSFLNYEGYPASICVSINEEVVHGIPSSRKIKSGDVVSIDVGVCKNGVHADTARTYIVGSTIKEVKDLVENTKKALYEGIKIVKPGIKLNEVCKKIESIAKEHNYGVIRELTGHGVGTSLHEDPYIPNYSNKESESIILKPGMTLAIEPMFALHSREIYLLEDGWGIITQDESVAAHFEHSIVVTEDGYEILTGE